MVFEPIVEAARRLGQVDPRKWRKLHFNFITCHYMYLVSMTIIGSIILYPKAGLLPYIDALFFAAGASTQSGLNTVDVNNLYLYQQVTLMLIACVCNPIFINSAVVFVRLYWFEKRFHNLVKEVREQRRSRAKTITRTKSEMRNSADLDRLEKGVNGREIKVLHDATKVNGDEDINAGLTDLQKDVAKKLNDNHALDSESVTPRSSNRHSDQSDEIPPDQLDHVGEREHPNTPAATYLGMPPRLHRDITFADELPAPGSDKTESMPAPIRDGDDMDKHILFLERQRGAAKETNALRIPGPRDVDLGAVPQELEAGDLRRPQTRGSATQGFADTERSTRSVDGRSDEVTINQHPRRGITINEPQHPGHHRRDSESVSGSHFDGVRDRVGRVLSGISQRHNRSRGPPVLTGVRRTVTQTLSSLTTARSRERDDDPMPYLSWQATTGRNSAFLGLTPAQREELGGIEYRALKTLAKILIAYFVGFHALGMAVLLPWIMHTQPWKSYVQSVGQDAGWWGVFTPASMFNDLGYTITPDSMISFQTAVLPLLFGSYLIIIGNTGFPCMLRFTIWVASKLTAHGSATWEELRFLLDHPRRCFTLLFPSRATWWLFWILVLLNGIDLVFFIILDLNDTTVTSLAPGFRVLNGWFQAVSTRTAGFGCVNLANLHPAIQVSYLIMMYISVFPIAISVRRTNVYEEKSLGIWGGEEEDGEGGEQSYVGQHLRRQLSFDLWYVFLGFFIICIVEGGRLENTNDYGFTMFSVLFEIVSAYGTVGLSLGYPTINASFSAEFKVISKLVIIAMMLRGRHRGLPYALDRAILLPSDNLHKKDDEIAALSRRRSSIFNTTGSWQEGDLDEMGLPKQHPGGQTTDAAMTAGAGGFDSPDGMSRTRRRPSAVTTASQASDRDVHHQRLRRPQDRRRSVGALLSSGLSAGPTWSRSD
ncbi:hypothetical protein BAUCODRAFT_36363 [Baudoinia panamericana UAMH 10762]|uniref:Potassium transport protein n=1 Tax=Baudoinia panamericana (strain UAMH 10762) TaxID=717646 RepID=M2MBM6_BAUPA|nr:uncharacterized protein BAUCODRAFT_36363 [Baudoinia panamericana UAMH 10762]EMC93911.1 hypothetical protein BAUCODRAFT_36363 [Baudoinia panamericana UAMH 10762]